MGLSPSPVPLSRGLGPGPPLRTLLQTTIRTPRATDSQAGLFPVRSPLLRESLDTGSRVTGTGRGRGAMKRPHPLPLMFDNTFTGRSSRQVSTMILPQRTAHVAAIRTLHRTIQSVGATGGVYKGQGRSQRELMTRAY
ncbi:hypothetical protein V6N13_116807 [Hibiscus sabdariffa]